MNLSPIAVIARKELTDGCRDHRSLYTLLTPIVLGPLLIAFMVTQLIGQKRAADEMRIPVVGGPAASVLVSWLQQQSGVQVIVGPSDPEGAVRDRKEDVVLVIGEEFAAKFSASEPAPVQVLSDSTRSSAQPKVKRLVTLLSNFSAELASRRLIVRGLNPEVGSPLKLRQVDVADAQQRGVTLLNVVLMILPLAIVLSGMQVATDSTAGERERRSLESLLVNPIPRWQIVAGKWAAAALVALAGLAAAMVAISIALSRLPLEDLGFRFQWGTPQMARMLGIMAPLALLVPAIQIYVSGFAKSFKEAQGYTTILVVPVAITGVVTSFYSLTAHPWMRSIPLLMQYAIGSDILAGRTPPPVFFAAAAIEAVTLTLVLLWLAARLFTTETIIFGR